jgi:hypothetical protein
LTSWNCFFKKAFWILPGWASRVLKSRYTNKFIIHNLGIQILREIPEGSPSILQPNLIPSEALVDFPKFLDYLKPKNKTWWQ